MTCVAAGAIQVVLGIARSGIIAYYFPSSVIKGMLAGIGIIIILKQIPHALGYDADFEGDQSFVQPDSSTTFSTLMDVVDRVTPGAVLVSVVCLGILLLWETRLIKGSKVLAMVPGPLLAVIVGVILGGLQSGFGDHGLEAVHYVDLPDLSKGVAAFTFPDWGTIGDPRVWTLAVTLAIVASLETLLCVEATDKLDPHKHTTPTDRELLAQGAGNILSGLIGGLPVTQVIVRSSANIQAGGRSKLSTILHGALILLAIIVIPGIMELIPLASLAAILFVVGYKLAKPSLFKQMWQKGWTQFVPFVVTIVAMIFTDLLTGVLLGMAVGVFVVLRNTYLTPFHFDTKPKDDGKPIRIALGEVVTFFHKASIQRALTGLPSSTHVVVDASGTMDLDPDVRELIEECTIRAEEEGVRIEFIAPEERKRQATGVLTSRVQRAADRRSKKNRVDAR
ncbi:MAG: SulP family inorganic anion transporter [Flavobacteriales bacterium]|nr:SulP family inorganic anion transporter [Flavobacteriales bacterium]